MIDRLVFRLLLAVATMLVATTGSAQRPPRDRWIATWAPSMSAARQRPGDTVDRTPTLANRTLREIVHVSVGGARMRIHLSNLYGSRPLILGGVHVALRTSSDSIDRTTDRPVTFNGRSSVVIRAGANLVSDAVALSIPNFADVAISLFTPDTARLATSHALAQQTNYVSAPGDFTAAEGFVPDTTLRNWPFVAGVDVVNPAVTGVIVAFGNSITDGVGSSRDSNSRWPDVLARRLLSSREPLKAVVNAGISGNRVLSPGAGESALARFDRDVLMQPGATHVIVLEGINDINGGTNAANPRDEVTIEELIAGHQQLIDRAHERGLVILGATLTPEGGLRGASPARDAKRVALNSWIRTSGAYDGVIDFDKVTRDPADTTRFLPAYDSGDHLHPSDAGYMAMGNAIDLALFRTTRR
ncbi:MAG TPA: SGNH/GDSL hydrolase family protein [Gemmatimonadaceae bacterium]|jgi:lysophospholipase L1-like esterase|nr:SGNH/GDSL hydrolase family protein [Gemmatimonadaceae bacterium]